MTGDGDLVVRQELLRQLLGASAGVVRDVRGIPGAGKSVLLREVERRTGRDDVVVLVEMQDYFRAFEQGEVAARGDGDAGGELRRFGRAVTAVMNGLRDRPTAAPKAVEEILNDAGKLDDRQARERADVLIEWLRAEINRLIAARTESGGRVYVLVDTFELVLGRPLGQWFLRLLDGLDGAVTAVARRAGPEATPLPDAAGVTQFGEVDVLDVGGMTTGQVRDYLVRRLGLPGGEIAAAVHGFTGGHALSVGLTADLAREMRRRGEPVTADGPLGDLIAQLEAGRDDDTDRRLGRLVTRFIESVKEPGSDAGKGLDCLWAVRRFDFRLLERLLAVGGGAGGSRLAERLVGYSFVERRTPRTPPGRSAEPYYVVHDRVRQQGRELLSKSERLKALLEEAQDYYQGRATETLDNYERWFQYEDETWQVIAREWLYHVSQLSDDKRGEGRLGMAVLFMDAFWWYGNYVPFPFCEELLADWAEMAGASRNTVDRDWGEGLREVYQRYPKGWRREATSEDWGVLRERLINLLREQKELQEEKEPQEEGQGKDPREKELRDQKNKRIRHVRGLLLAYLAEAEQFLDPRNRRVEELLAEARDLFAEDDDEWDAAWILIQQADAMLGRGDAEGAVAAAETGWRDLSEMDDDEFELAANLHRIHADAAWARGQHALSLDLYARAALVAYKFQVVIGDSDIPPIDEYSQAFMAEMHERTAERLAALHEAGDDQTVREAGARIRQFFDPYWRAVGQPGLTDPVGLLAAGKADEAVSQLFPAVPAAADLHRQDTEYALTANEVLYDMEDELTEPPGTALPSAAS